MSEELKQCQCGNYVEMSSTCDRTTFAIFCSCGMITTLCDSEEKAAKIWNRRPIEDALRAENDRLKEFVSSVGELFEGGAGDGESLINDLAETARDLLKKEKP